MSARTWALLRAADDGLRVVEHLLHRDGDRRVVAEDDHAEGVADEEDVDAGGFEEAGRGVVVAGHHDDALAALLLRLEVCYRDSVVHFAPFGTVRCEYRPSGGASPRLYFTLRSLLRRG